MKTASAREPSGAGMRLVTTTIKPARLDDLHQELQRIGIAGMTVTEVRSLGKRRVPSEIYRGTEYAIDFLPRYKVEVVVDDPLAEAVIEAIERVGGDGRVDDGAVFELAVGRVVRIRTGETDVNAI
jgi:nitrogen regulatory protein PII